jgi:hypothetical protein
MGAGDRLLCAALTFVDLRSPSPLCHGRIDQRPAAVGEREIIVSSAPVLGTRKWIFTFGRV